MNDLIRHTNSGWWQDDCTAVVKFNLSSAFDTVDNNSQLTVLHDRFAVDGLQCAARHPWTTGNHLIHRRSIRGFQSSWRKLSRLLTISSYLTLTKFMRLVSSSVICQHAWLTLTTGVHLGSSTWMWRKQRLLGLAAVPTLKKISGLDLNHWFYHCCTYIYPSHCY